MTDDRVNRAMHLSRSGWTDSQVAEEIGVASRTILGCRCDVCREDLRVVNARDYARAHRPLSQSMETE